MAEAACRLLADIQADLKCEGCMRSVGPSPAQPPCRHLLCPTCLGDRSKCPVCLVPIGDGNVSNERMAELVQMFGELRTLLEKRYPSYFYEWQSPSPHGPARIDVEEDGDRNDAISQTPPVDDPPLLGLTPVPPRQPPSLALLATPPEQSMLLCEPVPEPLPPRSGRKKRPRTPSPAPPSPALSLPAPPSPAPGSALSSPVSPGPATQALPGPPAAERTHHSVVMCKSLVRDARALYAMRAMPLRLKAHAIEIRDTFSDAVTHLVMPADENRIVQGRSIKYALAVLRGIWIVTPDWAIECVRRGTLVDEAPFEIAGDAVALGAPAKGRQRVAQGRPPLLHGLCVHLLGEFYSPPRGEIAQFLRLAGALNVTQPRAGSSTVVICDPIDSRAPLDAFLAAVGGSARAPPVVSSAWLFACLSHFEQYPFGPARMVP